VLEQAGDCNSKQKSRKVNQRYIKRTRYTWSRYSRVKNIN